MNCQSCLCGLTAEYLRWTAPQQRNHVHLPFRLLTSEESPWAVSSWQDIFSWDKPSAEMNTKLWSTSKRYCPLNSLYIISNVSMRDTCCAVTGWSKQDDYLGHTLIWSDWCLKDTPIYGGRFGGMPSKHRQECIQKQRVVVTIKYGFYTCTDNLECQATFLSLCSFPTHASLPMHTQSTVYTCIMLFSSLPSHSGRYWMYQCGNVSWILHCAI